MLNNHRVIASILGITIGIWLALFLGYFVYYLWQFKYGSAQELAKVKSEFRSAKFTTAGGSEAMPKAPTDWESYIHPGNPTLGNPNSPVTLVAFIDFECPFSQEDYPKFKSIMETYGPGVKIIFKQLPLASIHEHALAAAEAATCAQEQGKFWPFYHYLFTNKLLTNDSLTKAGEVAKLDMQKFADCQASDRPLKTVEADVDDAVALGVRGTPTYFVNQDVIEGVTDRAVWDSIMVKNFKK